MPEPQNVVDALLKQLRGPVDNTREYTSFPEYLATNAPRLQEAIHAWTCDVDTLELYSFSYGYYMGQRATALKHINSDELDLLEDTPTLRPQDVTGFGTPDYAYNRYASLIDEGCDLFEDLDANPATKPLMHNLSRIHFWAGYWYGY